MNDETRRDTMTFMQTVTTIAVVVFALLLVTVERPLRIVGRDVLPFTLGIVGLLFVGVALMAMDSFRERWSRSHPASEDASQIDVGDAVPLLFEIGLWGLGLLYVVRLVEIARG
jgi:hypothetical protein